MSAAPKPIETRYKGYRFRSRLEARWAVFFDTLGIPWDYESQGYETEMGPYLPDFVLWGRITAEVKPHSREIVGDALPLLNAYCRNTGHQLVMLIGVPEFRWYPVMWPIPAGEENGSGVIWNGAPPDGAVITTHFVSREYLDFGMSSGEPDGKGRPWYAFMGHEWPDPKHLTLGSSSDAFMKGVFAARGARFEHGERP